MTRTALLVSPHLDDVAFSCGGTAALLAEAGWHTVLATCFTRSITPAAGFALECQRDKGLRDDVDYMALRRAEDRRAAAILGIAEIVHLDLPEAPHRGYDSADALFGPYATVDTIAAPLTALLQALIRTHTPDLIFAPQGLGSHVDHRRVIDALAARHLPIAWYRDTPYAIRNRTAVAAPVVEGSDHVIDIAPMLGRKIAAAQAYTTQIGFQFGGADAAAAALTRFAGEEAERGAAAAERLRGTCHALASLVAVPA